MPIKRRTFLVLLFTLYTPLYAATNTRPLTREQAKTKSQKNCFSILAGVSDSRHLPLAPSLNGQPDSIVENHTLRADEWIVENFLVKQKQVVQGDGTLPTSLLRDGNFLELSYQVPMNTHGTVASKASSREQNEKINQEALKALDESRSAVATMAVELEKTRRDFPQSVIEGLKEAAPRHWDATIFEFRDKTTNEMVGSMRIDSSGPDRRLLAYPEILKNFMTGKYKGRWISKKVDPSHTKLLILEEILSKELGKPVEVERPVFLLDTPVVLPDGKFLTEIVGEAKEIGALSVRKDVNAKVFNLLTQQMLISLFNPNYSKEYNEQGQVFYAWGEKAGIRLWSNGMGFEQLNPEKPFNLSGQDWWIMRHTPQTMAKWIDGIARKPTTSKEEEDRLRYILEGVRGTDLTDEYRQIWHMYYIQGKTQTEIAKALKTSFSKVFSSLKSSNAKLDIKVAFPYYDQDKFVAGAQQELFEESVNFGIRRLTDDFGTKKLILKLAERLPDSVEKTALIEELNAETWGWTEYAGQSAKQGVYESSQAIYFGLYRIARILKNSPHGAKLDLSKLHEAEEFQKFLSVLDPSRLPLLRNSEQKKTFINRETGVFPLIQHLSRALDIKGIYRNEQIKALMLKMLQSPRLAESAEKETLIKKIESWEWTGNLYMPDHENHDFTSNRSNAHRENFQKLYQALYGIASLAKVSSKTNDINPENIWQPKEIQKVIEFLHPELPKIEYERSITRTETTSTKTNKPSEPSQNIDGPQVLASLARTVGNSFSGDFAMRDFVYKLAEQLPDGKNKEKVQAALKKYKWNANDGQKFFYSSPDARKMLFDAAHLIASALKQSGKAPQLDLENLNTASEMEKFTDLLILGTNIAPLTEVNKATFEDRENGSLAELPSIAKSLGIPRYNNFGIQNVMMELLKRSQTSSEFREKIIKAISDANIWGWKQNDAIGANDGVQTAVSRAYRALIATATVVRGHELSSKEVAKLCTKNGVNELLLEIEAQHNKSVAKIPIAEELNPKNLTEFENGGRQVLLNVAREMGKPFVKPFGMRDLVYKLAERLPEGSDKEAVQKMIKNWKWGSADGQHAFDLEGERIRQKLFQSVHLIATAFKNSGKAPQLDLKKLHTASEMEKFTNLLLLGVNISPLTNANKTLFMDREKGSLMELQTLAKTLGINKFTSSYGIQNLMIELLNRSNTQSEFREKIVNAITDVNSWGWKENDVANVRDGSEPAIIRTYRAMIATATVVRGRELTSDEISKLCTAKGINELILEIHAQQKSNGSDKPFTLIPTAEQLDAKSLKEFQEGGQKVLFSLARMSGKGKTFASDFGMRDLVYKLAELLPEGQNKEETLTTLKGWAWTAKDGKYLTEDARQRLFQAAQLIASTLNKSGKAPLVDLKSLRTAAEMEKFVDHLMLGASVAPLTEANQALFTDREKGSLWELPVLSRSTGIDLSEKYGIQKLLMEILNRSQTKSEFRDKITKAISDAEIWGWKEIDATVARRGLQISIIRIYRGLIATAMVVRGRELTPKEVTHLCTREGIRELLREIQDQ